MAWLVISVLVLSRVWEKLLLLSSPEGSNLILMTFLMALVQVCDQKTSKFFVPRGRICGRTCGCKWNLLEVREEKYKGKHGGA
jgi:hypothetical protein